MHYLNTGRYLSKVSVLIANADMQIIKTGKPFVKNGVQITKTGM